MEWRAQVEKELADRKAAAEGGEEEFGPPGHNSRQEIVKALFPLRCDIAVIVLPKDFEGLLPPTQRSLIPTRPLRV
jgi:hypothetical protein